MKTLIYLLQVSACTAIFFLFYKAILQKLTFFTINRWYLVATLLVSFIIPGVTIPAVSVPVAPVLSEINYQGLEQVDQSSASPIVGQPESINWGDLLTNLYWVATSLLIFQFIISLLVFFRRIRFNTVEKVGGVRLIRGAALKNGSFLNYIFLNEGELTRTEAEQILAHELEHIRRCHSLDKILARATQIILWFNPFSYLYAKAIEINHEFEVDNAISQKADKNQYAELILKLATQPDGQFYNHFSKFPLRTRLNMLFARPSRRFKKVAYLFLLPLVLISCIAFADRGILPIKSQANALIMPQQDGVASHALQISSGASLSSSTPRTISGTQMRPLSAIDGIEKLGKNPLVEIDGKIYPSSYLYKIGKQCIRGTTVYLPAGAIAKFGARAKDGAVLITTNGEITYLTAVDRENIKAERSIQPNRIYNVYRIKKEDGSMMYGVRIDVPKGGNMSNEVHDLKKVGFMIDNRVCDKDEFVNTIAKLGRAGIGPRGTGPGKSYQLEQFEAVFWINTRATADTLKIGENVDKRLFQDVKYSASDSIRLSKDRQLVYLYGKADLAFRGLKIQEADYIEINKTSAKVFAKAHKGSKLGFGINSQVFEADSMQINLVTMKAKSFGLSN